MIVVSPRVPPGFRGLAARGPGLSVRGLAALAVVPHVELVGLVIPRRGGPAPFPAARDLAQVVVSLDLRFIAVRASVVAAGFGGLDLPAKSVKGQDPGLFFAVRAVGPARFPVRNAAAHPIVRDIALFQVVGAVVRAPAFLRQGRGAARRIKGPVAGFVFKGGPVARARLPGEDEAVRAVIGHGAPDIGRLAEAGARGFGLFPQRQEPAHRVVLHFGFLGFLHRDGLAGAGEGFAAFPEPPGRVVRQSVRFAAGPRALAVDRVLRVRGQLAQGVVPVAAVRARPGLRAGGVRRFLGVRQDPTLAVLDRAGASGDHGVVRQRDAVRGPGPATRGFGPSAVLLQGHGGLLPRQDLSAGLVQARGFGELNVGGEPAVPQDRARDPPAGGQVHPAQAGGAGEAGFFLAARDLSGRIVGLAGKTDGGDEAGVVGTAQDLEGTGEPAPVVVREVPLFR